MMCDATEEVSARHDEGTVPREIMVRHETKRRSKGKSTETVQEVAEE